MLVNTGFKNIGDSLTIVLEAIVDAISFQDFVDVTDEVVDRYFDKYFRFSQDDQFTYTDWIELTQSNLQAQTLNSLRIIWMEVKYIRQGSNSTGILNWNYFELQVNVDIDQVKTLYPIIFTNRNHIFGHIEVNDVDWHTYCINLAKKLWAEGISANFIDRTNEFWYFIKTIACYLSLYYRYAIEYERILDNVVLLRDWLKQRGLYFCGKEDLTELRNMAANYYDKIRKRGTIEANDEIKKVICYNECDEFIFNLINNNHSGWFVDVTSPNYLSLEGVTEINKMPGINESVGELDEYVLVNSSYIALTTDINPEGDIKTVMNITNELQDCGIYYDKIFDIEDNFIMNVDPELNYEISFMVKQINNLTEIDFGVDVYDCSGNHIDCIDLVTGGNNNSFIDFATSIDIYPKNEYVKFRGILFNKDESLRSLADAQLNIGVGNYLKMPANAAFIYPRIIFKPGTVKDVNIYNVRVALLDHNIPMASYISLAKYVLSYIKNNSVSNSDMTVKNIIDKYLIPLKAYFDLNLLN